MISTTRKSLLPLLAGTLVFAGCDNITGPTGTVEVRLTQSAQATQSLTASTLLAGSLEGETTSRIPLSHVSSIEVTVTRVDALRRGASEEESAAWVSLDVSNDAKILDLLTVPSEGGITLAAGALEDGQYENLRLFISGATITFSNDVTIGSGPNPRTLPAGTHDLRIPSSAQSGIKIPVSFQVSRSQEGETTVVSVDFDSSASVRSLQWTAKGVQMSPVLTPRP